MSREDEIKAERLAIEAHQRRLGELMSDVWPKDGDSLWNAVNPERTWAWTAWTWRGTPIDNIWLSLGLLHRTQEDAQMHHELMKVVQELRECDGFRPFVVGRENYCFEYDVKSHMILNDWLSKVDGGWEHLYYETSKQRDAALAKVGRARVLKVMQWAAGRGR